MIQPRPVALVTGAPRRVGRQIALTLADAGYDLAITYHSSQSDAEELAGLIQKKGAKALAIAADLTDVKTIGPISQSVRSTFGRLNVLVNNASVYEPGGLTDDIAQKMWTIHVQSPYALCHAFEKELRAAQGHVINMLDLLAERPMPQYAAYCATKAALWNLTLSLARELAPDVTVNGIAPGVVDWPQNYPEADKEKYLRRVPLARAGTPTDVAGAVLFLARQATYMTGQILRLDGGRSLT